MSRRHARTARRPLALEPLEPRDLLATLATPSPEFFVRFQPAATPAQEAAAVAAVGGTTAATYPGGPTLVRVASAADVAGAVTALRSSPLVAYAEADSTVRASSIVPNDPAFPFSWGLNSANDVDIDAPEAWSITTGSPSVIVAVLDSGIDLSNPDFAGRVLPGYNFVSSNTNVQDDDGHGTHVSSLIAAAGNDGRGTAGVAWNVRIMPLKFLDANGDGFTSDAVSAIYYAVNNGARIINASWGGFQPTQALRDAIAYANSRNVVFVTAAGNEGSNNDVTPSYPASYRLPNELSVTAVDRNGALPYFANYGRTTVDIAAPGESIVGDWPTSLVPSGFQVESGTSMSTAYVSGVVALLASVHPEFSAAQLVQQVVASAKPLASMAGKTVSGGMVDAYRALVSSGIPAAPATPSGIPALAAGVLTDAQLQATLLATDEFFAGQGGTGAGFIAGLYNKLLARSPDPGGFAFWLNLYNQGVSTRYNIALAIATSTEGYATQVAGWYQSDLGRPGSIATLKADPGVQLWAGALQAGASAAAVENAILASPEYITGHGGAPFPVVAGWYQNILGRDADPFGLNAWAGQVAAGQAGSTVVRALQNSAEGKATRVARWFVTYLGRTQSVAALKLDPVVFSLATTLRSS